MLLFHSNNIYIYIYIYTFYSISHNVDMIQAVENHYVIVKIISLDHTIKHQLG